MAEVAVAEVTIIPVSRGATKQIEKELQGDKAGKKVGGQVGDGLLNVLGKTLKAGAAVAGGAALAGIGTALVKGFQRLDQLDKARAKLTGLGHDSKTVQKIMDNALASVKGTAFGMGEAATTAAGAVAAGVKPGKDLERTLKLVADASTIAGTDMGSMGAIFNKVAASNKVQMDVINQLHDAGVPALSLLADQMGVTAEEASKMASAGEIDFETFQKAMENGLGGAAMESGNTFSGAMDNVMAALGRLGASALDGVFQEMKGNFGDLTAWLDSLGPEIEKFGQAFGEFAADALPKVIAGLKVFGQVVVNVFKWVGDNITLVRNLGIAAGVAVAAILGFRAVLAVMQAYRAVMAVVTAAQLAYTAASYGSVGASYAGVAATNAQKVAALAGAAAQKTVAAAQALVSASLWKTTAAWVKNTAVMVAQKAAQIGMRVATLAGVAAMGIATAAQWAWNAAMSANPIGLIIVAVAALVAALVWFFTQTELGQEIWANFTQFLSEAWANISQFFIDTWTTISTVFMNVWNGIVAFFQTIWNFIVTFVTTYIQIVLTIWTTVWNAISTVFTNIWNGIVAVFQFVWSAIVTYVTTYITIVKTIITTVVNVIKTVWNTVWNGIKSFFVTIWNGIVTGVKTYINIVKTVITTVINTVKKVWSSVWGGIKSFFTGIWDGIVSTVSGFKKTFSNVFGGIKGIVTTAFKGVLGVVKAPINGIIGLINGAIGALNKLSVTIPDWVPVVGGQTWGLSLPKIPYLANGGVAYGPSQVMIGEGRYPEAVVPLGGPQMRALADAFSESMGRNETERPVDINVTASDPFVTARVVAEYLR